MTASELKGWVQRLGCTRSGRLVGNTRLCQRIDKPIVSAFAIPVFLVVGMAIGKNKVAAFVVDIGGLLPAFGGEP